MNNPGSRLDTLDDSFHRSFPELGTPWQPEPAPDPTLVAFNDTLATELGLDAEWLSSDGGLAVLAGNTVPAGAHPIAMAYAGHQFGSYSPRLGDGRALLLGELVDGENHRFDIHLKGSGRTPFARSGDGKAALGPMLREYVMAEAMAALGIATGRSLAVASTGALIARETVVPAAVLTRVAASHIRVGTFEYAARVPTPDGEPSVVRRLADYAIERHYPQTTELEPEVRYLRFLDAVIESQAALIARWMLVGFIHGVMNTDNMAISGETIDYGPCAFLDIYDPATVFSSIDRSGRYAYRNQPAIAQWDLARLAETLLPLLAPSTDEAVEVATEALQSFSDRYHQHWLAGMGAKLGLDPSTDPDTAQSLAEDYLDLLAADRLDYTSSFRSLADRVGGGDLPLAASDNVEGWSRWFGRWRAHLKSGSAPRDTAAAMNGVNPVYIPRNHLVEQALTEAVTGGDFSSFRALVDRVTAPWEPVAGAERYGQAAPDEFYRGYQTFCGT